MESISQATIGTETVRGAAPSLRFAAGFCALAALAGLVPFIPHVPKVLAAATLLAMYLGYLLFRARRGGFDWFEVFVPYGAFFVLAYGGGTLFYAFNPDQLFRRSLVPYLTPALLVGTAGFAAFLFGYAIRGIGPVRRSPLESWRLAGIGVAVLAAALGFVGQFANAMTVKLAITGGASGGLVSLAGQFGFFFPVAWFLAWHHRWSKPSWRPHDWVGFGAISTMAALVATLHVGTKETVIVLGAIPLIAYWYARRRFPVTSVVALLLVVVLVVFPIYNTFRYTDVGLDTGARLRYTLEVASRWDTATYLERTVLAFLGRVAYITSTAAVLRDVGRHVDYKWGETLLRAPISILIPRIIWPEKPTIGVGREFGETFRLIHARDEETQIGASSIGELYWNFGTAGVIAGMLLFGMVFRWFYRRYGEGESRDDAVRRSFYLILLIQSWHIEGGIAGTLAGAFKIVLLLWFFYFVLRRLGGLVPASPAHSDAGAAPAWSK